MMKMNSISGFTCYVKDIKKTTDFYEALGFVVARREPAHLLIRLNWFTVSFHQQNAEEKPEFQKEANLENKGAGLFINIKVENVDEFYEGVVAKGMKPSSEPRDWPWGNREFVLRDPDGYKLVFFNKV
jgi:catechol 2,3-dioxygenase-like lactoylglutathione lyase family enzyme